MVIDASPLLSLPTPSSSRFTQISAALAGAFYVDLTPPRTGISFHAAVADCPIEGGAEARKSIPLGTNPAMTEGDVRLLYGNLDGVVAILKVAVALRETTPWHIRAVAAERPEISSSLCPRTSEETHRSPWTLASK